MEIDSTSIPILSADFDDWHIEPDDVQSHGENNLENETVLIDVAVVFLNGMAIRISPSTEYKAGTDGVHDRPDDAFSVRHYHLVCPLEVPSLIHELQFKVRAY